MDPVGTLLIGRMGYRGLIMDDVTALLKVQPDLTRIRHEQELSGRVALEHRLDHLFLLRRHIPGVKEGIEPFKLLPQWVEAVVGMLGEDDGLLPGIDNL